MYLLNKGNNNNFEVNREVLNDNSNNNNNKFQVNKVVFTK